MLQKTNNNTQGKAGDYIDPIRVDKPTKAGIMVISEMSTGRIIGYMARKHKVGLLYMTNAVQLYVILHVPVMHLYNMFIG